MHCTATPNIAYIWHSAAVMTTIQRIVMRLFDINGPRGSVDKHCHIQVVLAGLPDVIIEDTEADMYVAINRATDRAGRTLIRRGNRQQTLQKQSCPLPLLSETSNDTIKQQERGL